LPQPVNSLLDYVCVHPFGIATDAQFFIRLLGMIFNDMKFKFVSHYLDDLVIYISNFDQHLGHVAQVLSRLRDAGLTVNPSNVVFAVQEISFLGHRVPTLEVSIDPRRTEAIRRFLPPSDAKGTARFIGMVNFYHKFIPHLADIAAPLNALRKKGVKFVWSQDHQTAFDKLKEAISQPPCCAWLIFLNLSFCKRMRAVLLWVPYYGNISMAVDSRSHKPHVLLATRSTRHLPPTSWSAWLCCLVQINVNPTSSMLSSFWELIIKPCRLFCLILAN
jgi:hypothetical protein